MSRQRQPSPTEHIEGVLVVDKPLRMSSMTAVSIVRRKAGGVKTGHAGTLDPLATGVLLIALGKATKCIDQFMATTKRYETTINLSAFTTTDDLEGERTDVAVISPPGIELVREAVRGFVGRIMQQPPAFSAMKIDGQRAYKMARKGQTVDIPARPVVVHSLNIVRYEWPMLELTIHCDKGFYVRSLARDLGSALNTGGHCTAIRRTAVGPFTLEMARTIDDLPARIAQHDVMSMADALGMIGPGVA